jgi:hypothetical protein
LTKHIDGSDNNQEIANNIDTEQESIDKSKSGSEKEKKNINNRETDAKPNDELKIKKNSKNITDQKNEIEHDKINNCFIVWNGVPHLQLWHKDNKEETIHFPWANNSCALDSTLTALWIIYLRLQTNNERLALFEAEYPKIIEVFTKLYHGTIHNVEAKNQFIMIFKDLGIRNEDYRSQKFVELNCITNYLKDSLHVLLPDNDESTFSWKFKSYWQCNTCSNEIGDDFVYNRENISFMARSLKFSVQDCLDTYIEDSLRETICETCGTKNALRRKTIIHPTILHLLYPTADKNGHLDIPVFLEKEIVLDGIYYDLVGSAYGGGGHFIFRYLKDDKVYEADGMDMSRQIINKKKIRGALSRELQGNHKLTLAGHINFKFNKNKDLIERGKKIVDVYYLKR